MTNEEDSGRRGAGDSGLCERTLLATVWQLAWPTVLFSMSQSLLGLVDLFMVRSFGKGATAGLGFSLHLLMLVSTGALAVSMGTITLVAQFTGAENTKGASRVAGQSILMMFALGMLAALPGVLLSGRMLVLLGARGMALVYGKPYLMLMFWGGALFMVNFSVFAIFRGAGDTLTPLKIGLAVNVINIIGNWLFINGVGPFPMMAVAGAAVGTLVARFLGAVIGVSLLASGRYVVGIRFDGAKGRVNLPLIRRMLRVGLPAAIQGFFRNGARVLFLSIVAGSTLGATATAAYTIGGRLRMVTVMPALAFQVAAAALVGQSIGSGDLKRAEGAGWEAVKLCTLIMIPVTVLLCVFARPLVGIFQGDPEVIDVGTKMMYFFAVGQFFTAVAIVSSGGLVGAGDTRPALYYTIVSQWMIMLPLAWVLMRLGLDPVGAWIAWFIAPIIQAVLTLLRFRSGKWKHIKV